MEITEKIRSLEFGETFPVEVDQDIRDTMRLLAFQEESLNITLQALRENRYGLYNKDAVVDIMVQLEDKRVEREKFIGSVGEKILGADWRKELDSLGAEFQIDTALPVVVFFKVAR